MTLVRSFAGLLAAVLLSCGGPRAASPADKVRDLAIGDLECGKSDIRTTIIDERTIVASGCEKHRKYVAVCERHGSETCMWIAEESKARPTRAPKEEDHEPVVRGTCFAIAKSGHLLTAEHVVTGLSAVDVQFPGGPKLRAKVAAAAREDDVAILKVDVETPDYLPLVKTSSVARPGSRVFTFGFPVADLLGMEPKFTDGSVSALSGIDGEPRVMQITVPIQPGNSGGPLVTESGFAIGVVSATVAASPFFEATGTLPQGINWAVKADYALALIKRGPETPPPVDRDAAVERARKAVCAISARTGQRGAQ